MREFQEFLVANAGQTQDLDRGERPEGFLFFIGQVPSAPAGGLFGPREVACGLRSDGSAQGPAGALRPGTVLDGEAVIWRDGRLDFAAAQSRAASSVTRARALAARHPASYACWDVLQHPDPAIGDCRSRPYTTRRAYLMELLADGGPPIQAVPAPEDGEVAALWYDVLREQGIEGILWRGFETAHLTAVGRLDEG
ncbi:hypothetical protein ACFCX0_26920 [Streptomyces sp. NPDC056352]|uniref:ATP-dependent DNA ligase n=1 Tax=Streptomyces sp. NPDC056352 TaxID=3345791 RepID=UPI0035D809DD